MGSHESVNKVLIDTLQPTETESITPTEIYEGATTVNIDKKFEQQSSDNNVEGGTNSLPEKVTKVRFDREEEESVITVAKISEGQQNQEKDQKPPRNEEITGNVA